MKKTEIDFDFAKWGQEGISVIIQTKSIITLYQNSVITNRFYGLFEDGGAFVALDLDIHMFEEVKPREFWVNEYDDGSFGVARISKEEAESRRVIGGDTKLIKLVEVIE